MSNDPLPYATPASKSYPESVGRQIFGVIVRTAGLLLAIYGAYELIAVAVLFLFSSYGQPTAFFQAAFCAAVGVLLLIRGGWVVNLSYKRDE
jgi:hypothetical protein